VRYVLTPAELRAARWANHALGEARRKLGRGELEELELTPPRIPASGVRGVRAVLRLRRHSCLEGALVRRCWQEAHGDRRAVVIGVGRPSDGFGAHAWLDGDPDGVLSGMTEIKRI
jgi:hypothetical protein